MTISTALFFSAGVMLLLVIVSAITLSEQKAPNVKKIAGAVCFSTGTVTIILALAGIWAMVDW